jgi:hypothetical protein
MENTPMISLTTLSKKLSLLCMLLLGLQCLTVQGMKKRKRNIFEGICKASSTERLPLFQKLYSKHIDSTLCAKEINIALKEELIRMNKTSKATIKDVGNCLNQLTSRYGEDTNYKSDAHVYSSNFLDAILPHLLEGHDFSKETHDTNTHQIWLHLSASNIYLVKSLLYFYNVPLSNYEAYGWKCSSPYSLACNRISHFGFVLNGTYYKAETGEERIAYLKAILTPPDRFIQEARECSLPIIETFLLCTKRLQRSLSHRLPKILVKKLIMPAIINDAIPEKYKDRCHQLKADVREQIKKEITRVKYSDGPDGAYNFLANDFEAWAQTNMNPAILAYPLLFGVTQ